MTYCSSLTNVQLENVLCIEHDRKERGGDVTLYVEARAECCRRGMDPDYILEENVHQQTLEARGVGRYYIG